WDKVPEKYHVGDKVKGKVVSIKDYGAFVELEDGVEGLIHVSEMSWQKPKHPSKVVEVGQDVECAILDVDGQSKRISLGLKQLEPDPWVSFTQRYNPGDIIRGLVRSITDYGVFIGIEDGVDGMVHKSDLSWTQRIINPADIYQKGDEVEAIILSVNHDEKKVSLGIKQLYEDPWNYIPERYPVGTVLEVTIISTADYGAFAEIEAGLEALVPRSEISYEFVEDPSKYVAVGQKVKTVIIGLDATERKITLSMKDAADRELDQQALEFQARQREELGRKIGPSGTAGATLGDVLGQKLGGAVKEEAAPEAPASDEATVSDEA
ncbi:MAG: S1 RNA-binding domain-containing protein, partial [Myxococcales bacterium]|nr:S1 RNA-binding domain-containing protein [Myxococcales bacterium]